MKELSEKYGDMTPFEDDALIDEIVAMTYPEVRTFFDTHVIGNTPIDYKAYFKKVGLASGIVEQACGRFFLDQEVPFIDADPSNDNAIFVRKGIALSSFLIDLGAQGGDIIKNINGTTVTMEGIRPILQQSFVWPAEKEITMVVLRGEEELTLSGTAGTPVVKVEKLTPTDSQTEAQIKLREAWMKS